MALRARAMRQMPLEDAFVVGHRWERKSPLRFSGGPQRVSENWEAAKCWCSSF